MNLTLPIKSRKLEEWSIATWKSIIPYKLNPRCFNSTHPWNTSLLSAVKEIATAVELCCNGQVRNVEQSQRGSCHQACVCKTVVSATLASYWLRALKWQKLIAPGSVIRNALMKRLLLRTSLCAVQIRTSNKSFQNLSWYDSVSNVKHFTKYETRKAIMKFHFTYASFIHALHFTNREVNDIRSEYSDSFNLINMILK